MRYGTRTHCRRRWSRQARRPVCRVKLGYKWSYLYVALCPYTGDVLAMLLPHLNKACFALFVQQLAEHVREKGLAKVLLIGDGATAHTSQDWPSGRLQWHRLPTACPELNPVERFFQELRQQTANRVFDTLEQVEEVLQNQVRTYSRQPNQVIALTQYPYMKISA